jgi:hypothetical protein
MRLQWLTTRAGRKHVDIRGGVRPVELQRRQRPDRDAGGVLKRRMNTVENYLEARFAELEANDFQPLSASRCLMVTGTIRAYRTLTAADRTRYRRIIAHSRAAVWTQQPVQQSRDDEIWSTRFAQSCFPPEMPDAEQRLADASELRKVAKLCFEQLLGAQPRKSTEPGDWYYDGEFLGMPVSVELRYATRAAQLSYGVHLPGMAAKRYVSAEMLYGVGVGLWNRIYVHDIDQCFALLGNLVTMVVRDHVAIMALLREGR